MPGHGGRGASALARSLVAVESALEKASAALASVVIFAIMCLVVTDVVGRKLFNAPVQGAVEIAELSLPGIVFLGVAYVQARREHIRLELFSTRLPAWVIWSLDLFSTVLALAVSLLVAVQIGGSAWESWLIDDHTMGIVHIPIWPAKAAVFFGFCLLSVRLAIQLVEALFTQQSSAMSRSPGDV